MCAASLFLGGDKSSFSDQSKWAGSAPTGKTVAVMPKKDGNYNVIFGNDAQTSDLLIQGGSLVFGSGSKGSLIIGKEDCASSSGSCSKKNLGNIPSKYIATPVGSTVAVNKKTGIVTKDVVSAVKVALSGVFFFVFFALQLIFVFI